jgi:hypothetical protein
MPSVRNVLRRRRRASDEVPAESTDTVLTARAVPRKVLVEERYRVRQEVSRNPDIGLEEGASGVVRVELPYDGDRHVTRRTLSDVDHWVERHSPRRDGDQPTDDVLEGRIGHLVVSDHQDTDIAAVTGCVGRTIAIPLTVPFRSPELTDERALLADQFVFRQEIAYAPAAGRPELIPVQLDIQVIDPGSVTVQRIQPDDVVAQSDEYMTFENYLELRISVQVDMRNRKNWNPPPQLLVRRMTLLLPSGLRLALSSVDVTDEDEDEDDARSWLVQQNPVEGCLEWFDVPLPLGTIKEDIRSYHSPCMIVRIHQPGELFREPELVVRAEIEADGVLLSGADARLFDACGNRVRGRGNPLTIRSKITAEATVVLDDAFAKRKVRPQLKFHFDEVIPGQARARDVVAALVDLQFDVPTQEFFKDKILKTATGIAAIVATRGDPEDAINLFVYVTGRRHRTERQSQHPGGRRFTSKLDTGDLTLVVYGVAPRDARELIHDVNALQLGLRERFRRMKAQR